MGQGTESCGGYDSEYDPYEENLVDALWIQKDGTEIYVSQMSLNHLYNAMRVCYNNALNATFSYDEDKWLAWRSIMQDEIMTRQRKDKAKKSAKNAPITKVERTRKASKPVYGEKQEVTCSCGTVFEARTADIARGWGKSCSKSCAARNRKHSPK